MSSLFSKRQKQEPIFEIPKEILAKAEEKLAKNEKEKTSKSKNTKKANSLNKTKTKKKGFFRRLFRKTRKSVILPANVTIIGSNKQTQSAWELNNQQAPELPPQNQKTIAAMKAMRAKEAAIQVEEEAKQKATRKRTAHNELTPQTSQKSRKLASRRANLSNSGRKIKHFWYRDWPDHGAPELPKDRDRFVSFIDTLYNDINDNEGNTLIHCSAGVGRTGTVFVILKICLERQKNLTKLLALEENKVSQDEIDNAITYARMRRNLMVQSFPQYLFLLQLFNVKNNKQIRDTNKINKMIDRIMRQVDDPMDVHPENFKNIGIEMVEEHTQLFGKLCSLKKLQNQSKNRYNDILPYDDTIVMIGENKNKNKNNENVLDEVIKLIENPNLQTADTICSNYINANYLNKKIKVGCYELDKHSEDMYKLCDDKSKVFNGIVIGS